MTDEWYYAENGQTIGPISHAALRVRAASGALKPSDLVWQVGMSQWAPAGLARGLFPASTQIQAQPPVFVPAAPVPNRSSARPAPALRPERQPVRNHARARGMST